MVDVALVYPPFGPAELPSLGLSLLSGQAKRDGHRCRTFYWNLDVLAALPGRDQPERIEQYRDLTGRDAFPYNEWVFAEQLHGRRDLDASTVCHLLDQSLRDAAAGARADHLLALRGAAASLIDSMVAQLADAEVVGISTSFYQNVAALALAREVKRRRPDQQVVLGGANCDGDMGHALFEHYPFLDAVFVGEADHSFPAYLEALRRGDPPQADGILTRTGPSECVVGSPVLDLDALGSPDFSDWVAERRRVALDDVTPTVIALEASRGCWWGTKHHCTFCGLNALGMVYRRKDPGRFVDELVESVRTTGARFAFLTDNILSMDYLSSFAETPRLAEAGVELFFEVKANLRPDQIATLARNRITAVQPGIESLSSDLLHLMDKGVTAARNVEFLRVAQQHGVRAAYNILHSFPGEDPRWYDNMIDQLPRLHHLLPPGSLVAVEFHRFSPYHDDPERFGLKLRPAPGYDMVYPASTERLAYVFVDEASAPRPYVDLLRDAIGRWRRAYGSGARLSCLESGDSLVLWDTRPAFGPRFVHLHGHLACLHRALGTARTSDAAMRVAATCQAHDAASTTPGRTATTASEQGEVVVLADAGRGWVEQEPDAAVRLLDQLGLVFVDTSVSAPTRYVSLALPPEVSSLADHWRETGL